MTSRGNGKATKFGSDQSKVLIRVLALHYDMDEASAETLLREADWEIDFDDTVANLRNSPPFTYKVRCLAYRSKVEYDEIWRFLEENDYDWPLVCSLVTSTHDEHRAPAEANNDLDRPSSSAKPTDFGVLGSQSNPITIGSNASASQGRRSGSPLKGSRISKGTPKFSSAPYGQRADSSKESKASNRNVTPRGASSLTGLNTQKQSEEPTTIVLSSDDSDTTNNPSSSNNSTSRSPKSSKVPKTMTGGKVKAMSKVKGSNTSNSANRSNDPGSSNGPSTSNGARGLRAPRPVDAPENSGTSDSAIDSTSSTDSGCVHDSSASSFSSDSGSAPTARAQKARKPSHNKHPKHK